MEVKYRLIEEGNLGDSPEHVKYLEHGKDAFGNEITHEEGYRMLDKNEQIKKGDKHFDIYGGWVSGGEDWSVRNGHHARGEGRWRCWERKIEDSLSASASKDEETDCEHEPEQGNKLIAEFMDAKFSKVDYFGDGRISDEIKFTEHPSKLINGTGRTFSNFTDLRYHESWDWLMPVVEKIEAMDDFSRVKIQTNFCIINETDELSAVGDSKIIAVWNAVIQFIQWLTTTDGEQKD